MNTGFELLLVLDKETYWEVQGITYSNAMLVEPNCQTLRASILAIEQCKQSLAKGERITISKCIDFSEVLPSDLVIKSSSELDRHRQMALNEISARLHQAIFAVNVIDLMEYLNNYVCLLNAGYYITDSNREDKYFEVIESSQNCEEPLPLSENATFEEEQEYINKKQKYEIAQNNLSTLEKYLNSYDKLIQIKHIVDFLNDMRQKIENAATIAEIDDILKIYKSNLKNYKMVNIVD